MEELSTVTALIFGERNFCIERMVATDVHDVERFCVVLVKKCFVKEGMSNDEYKEALYKQGMFLMFPTEEQRDKVFSAMRMKKEGEE